MLYLLNLNGSHTFFTRFDLECYFVVFPNAVDQIGVMYKILFAAVVVFNESEPFVVVKEFNFSCFHDIK